MPNKDWSKRNHCMGRRLKHWEKINKKYLELIFVVTLFLFSIYSLTLPISNAFFDLSWLKIIMVCGSMLCGVALYVLVIVNSIKKSKNEKKYYYDILYISPLIVTEIINVLAIFDYKLWGFKAFFIGRALFITIFVELFASIRVLFKKSFGQENTPVVLTSLAVLSFILSALNESIGNIEPASLCYAFCFGLTYLVAIALYIHQFVYKPKKPEKIVSSIIGIIFWGSVITITFPYYINWCGLKGKAFEAFVSVYSALLGGGITLAGVAWTIKDSNDKRQEDLKRIKSERKEEERIKNVPYIKLVSEVLYDEYVEIPFIKYFDFNKLSDRQYFKDNKSYAVRISSFGIKNVSETNIIFSSVNVNNNVYSFPGKLIEKGKTCQIEIRNNSYITLIAPLDSIQLILQDMKGNSYSVKCKFNTNPNYKTKIEEEETSDGEKYIIIEHSFVVEELFLPAYFGERENK
ncbi:MAG: hypothetical protein E7387_01270 [Ruminococcaceae bacterium]|nr:hypothetical protein [Oscillospiraceae bacterium]